MGLRGVIEVVEAEELVPRGMPQLASLEDLRVSSRLRGWVRASGSLQWSKNISEIEEPTSKWQL